MDQQFAEWSRTMGRLTNTADYFIESRENVHFQH